MARRRQQPGPRPPAEPQPRLSDDLVPDRAPDLPGTQRSDPDLAAAVRRRHPIQPQRRGPGSR